MDINLERNRLLEKITFLKLEWQKANENGEVEKVAKYFSELLTLKTKLKKLN
ncbi:hypothetical protein NX772_01540 [Mesomycoplasma molare]|uniref:Uncharacterized protein n=1 Tax=Mesomycoplasma molare TaxID=171288 RepID=A0ABY5TY44_9BACT|nr:hypothetical protein [Mesomycoplasma molare]UWD34496.1 hypothetical protein NX772_01540 [Mesomycoplasma molare]